MSRRFTDAELAGIPLPLHARHASLVPQTSGRSPSAYTVDDPATSSVVRPYPSSRSAVYTPDGYEPNYAYPLVIWFHAAGEDERVLNRIMPVVSERNSLGLALRGEQALQPTGFDWAAIDSHRRAAMLFEHVREFRRTHHVHTERVVLAGRGRGAAVAAGLFFARPEWFGGLALLDLPSESLPANLTSSDDLAGKPVLLDLPVTQLGRGRDGASRFAGAGLDVTFRHARSGNLCQPTLRHLNHWLMATVCGVPV